MACEDVRLIRLIYTTLIMLVGFVAIDQQLKLFGHKGFVETDGQRMVFKHATEACQELPFA